METGIFSDGGWFGGVIDDAVGAVSSIFTAREERIAAQSQNEAAARAGAVMAQLDAQKFRMVALVAVALGGVYLWSRA